MEISLPSIPPTFYLFAGGAFAGLKKIINQRMDAASTGFGAKMKKELSDQNVQGNIFRRLARIAYLRGTGVRCL